jgi:hypothetical protein
MAFRRVDVVSEPHRKKYLVARLHRRLLAQLVVEHEAIHAVVDGLALHLSP